MEMCIQNLNTSLTCDKSKVINACNAFLTKACTHEYGTKKSHASYAGQYSPSLVPLIESLR